MIRLIPRREVVFLAGFPSTNGLKLETDHLERFELRNEPKKHRVAKDHKIQK